MKERLKTISRSFYNDEILYKDPSNGDIHLKEGVRRAPESVDQYTTYEDEDIDKYIKEQLKNKNTIEGNYEV